MINGVNIFYIFMGAIFSNKNYSKSIFGFSFWTYFFMSILRNPKKVFKKVVLIVISYHNALIYKIFIIFFVMIKFLYFI